MTSFELGVEAVEWSPIGDQLVVVAVTYTEEWSDIDDEERSRLPRRVTKVPYRFDTRAGGWTHDRRRHLWLIDPSDGLEPRCLTPGDFDEDFPAWSPDGTRIAFVSDRDPGQGLVSGNDVWEVDVETGSLTRVTDRGLWAPIDPTENSISSATRHPSIRSTPISTGGKTTELSPTSPATWIGVVSHCQPGRPRSAGTVTRPSSDSRTPAGSG